MRRPLSTAVRVLAPVVLLGALGACTDAGDPAAETDEEAAPTPPGDPDGPAAADAVVAAVFDRFGELDDLYGLAAVGPDDLVLTGLAECLATALDATAGQVIADLADGASPDALAELVDRCPSGPAAGATVVAALRATGNDALPFDCMAEHVGGSITLGQVVRDEPAVEVATMAAADTCPPR